MESTGSDSSDSNFTVAYDYGAGLDWPESFFIEEHPDSLLSTSISEDQYSTLLKTNNLSLIDEADEVNEIQFPGFGSSEYFYLSRIDKDAKEGSSLARSVIKTDSPEMQYIYKNEKAQQWLLDYSSSLGRLGLGEDEIDYMDRAVVDASDRLIEEIAPVSEQDEHIFRIGDSYNLPGSSPESITQLINTFTEANSAIGASAIVADGQTSSLFSGAPSSYLSESLPGSRYVPENLPSPRSRKDKKNYAIVIGIDEYNDRMSLHTCANDARSIADLMRELGYNVILLSDQTEQKPTKSNILDMAFEEIKNNKNIGNIIFYFSGHGVKEDDTFYLIPQDANGNVSSYISEYEIEQQVKDFKNLAVIIDACNSGGLSPVVGDGQLIIASSANNQSSNGEWTGSMSVFTSRLIKAIEEERMRSNRVLLQRCFERAKSDTVRWSKKRLINQTPIKVDYTGGIYFIN